MRRRDLVLVLHELVRRDLWDDVYRREVVFDNELLRFRHIRDLDRLRKVAGIVAVLEDQAIVVEDRRWTALGVLSGEVVNLRVPVVGVSLRLSELILVSRTGIRERVFTGRRSVRVLLNVVIKMPDC